MLAVCRLFLRKDVFDFGIQRQKEAQLQTLWHVCVHSMLGLSETQTFKDWQEEVSSLWRMRHSDV